MIKEKQSRVLRVSIIMANDQGKTKSGVSIIMAYDQGKTKSGVSIIMAYDQGKTKSGVSIKHCITISMLSYINGNNPLFARPLQTEK